jgi:predicted alpha/beta hydrolase family esterase
MRPTRPLIPHHAHPTMTDVLFVQGAGPGVHADGDIHLVESLRRELGSSYDVRYPQMPDEADPRMEAWRPVLQRELAELRPGGMAVLHWARCVGCRDAIIS